MNYSKSFPTSNKLASFSSIDDAKNFAEIATRKWLENEYESKGGAFASLMGATRNFEDISICDIEALIKDNNFRNIPYELGRLEYYLYKFEQSLHKKVNYNIDKETVSYEKFERVDKNMTKSACKAIDKLYTLEWTYGVKVELSEALMKAFHPVIFNMEKYIPVIEAFKIFKYK
jgi:hypothetical protein